MEIDVRLAQWRNEQGLTQRDLAEQLGVTQPAISDWERAHSPTIPAATYMAGIYLLSRGAVQPNDFFDLPPLAPSALDQAA